MGKPATSEPPSAIHPQFTPDQIAYLDALAAKSCCGTAELVVAVTLATCSEYSREQAAVMPGRGGWHSFVTGARRVFIGGGGVPPEIFNDRFFSTSARRTGR